MYDILKNSMKKRENIDEMGQWNRSRGICIACVKTRRNNTVCKEGIMCDRIKLAVIAREEAEKPYNGKSNNCVSNIQDIVALFPKWSVDEANGLWCAAFVYHCVILAGFKIPVRPKEASCSLAGCVAWEEWAQADNRIECHSGNDDDFKPAAGDIVLFDRVFNNTEHDHIGIVLEDYDDYIITAEGNVENVSRVLERKKNSHIRAYIRIPDNFSY